MTKEHTQGPWEVRTVDSLFAVAGPDDWIASIEVDELGHLADIDGQNVATNKANARLIAAAPDLLAALEEVLPHLEDYFGKEYGDDPPENDLLKRARAVIAKARGE